MSTLGLLFETTRQQRRAALVAYLPAGYPTVAASKTLLGATIDAGADLVEVGVPYSDPVMDGPTIQGAADAALRNGFRLKHLFEVVESVAARGGRAVVMTYYNPVYHYGVDAFARDLASAGGLGLITPDLTPDEGGEWLTAASEHGLDRIFLVAPSSSDERIALTTKATTGFVYATAVMGVTGARESVGTNAAELVRRTRQHTDLPVGVGLGVRSADQAAEVAGFADAVIVGSALVAKAGDGPDALGSLTAELAEGVRRPQH
ncbi:tryptophan synthase subunit alpha [Saccharomonospora piscinae]|uniref:Tryptophan synthase alpha chain n=1 Tax=Saccharomonospora piscinae TaxID=687388 RepID=A0A1V9A4T5_SACPI|nr:tryptophan synthase subunit alpha [Saccharomonospora piscinae]OQO92142.1 tryptophan synthase subunit alpha [Saccharomonospora piscinae]